MKTKDEVRAFLDSVGIATRVLTEEQIPNAEWGLIADKFEGTQANIPIIKQKGKNKVGNTMNISIDAATNQRFTESVLSQEFDLAVGRLHKVTIARPSPQIPKIIIVRNLYDDFSGQELIDSMEQIVKTIQFIFAFIRKHSNGKTDLKTSENITQGTG